MIIGLTKVIIRLTKVSTRKVRKIERQYGKVRKIERKISSNFPIKGARKKSLRIIKSRERFEKSGIPLYFVNYPFCGIRSLMIGTYLPTDVVVLVVLCFCNLSFYFIV